MMASNHAWVVPAGPTARRFAVFDVKNIRKDNRAYFNAIIDQMYNGGLAAMLHDLLHHGLNGFEVRTVPQTGALAEQKMHSLEPKAAWLLDILISGRVFDGDKFWRTVVATEDVQKLYASALRHAFDRSLKIKLGQFLEEVFKDQLVRAEDTVDRLDAYGNTHSDYTVCYRWPDLETARVMMEAYIGFKPRWPKISHMSSDY
jgi:hypothetical protein